MAGRPSRSPWHSIGPHVSAVPRNLRRLRYRAAAASKHLTVADVLSQYVFRVHTLLILLWVWLLHWGEVRIYEKEVGKCDWRGWEKWSRAATPHHVVFIADPQLIDPHTYPGRPWPLSSLTISFTDKYLKRSYRKINQRLDPDSLYFLGDLFDGGREWNTGNGGFVPSEKQWKKYGRGYWYGEYERFSKIFIDPDQVSGGRPERRHKQLVLSLPGNHDLGFAAGVQLPVRKRFRAYFGGTDRVDIIGNHSFVGIDAVSLSAKDTKDANEQLWLPSSSFLDHAKKAKRSAVEHYMDRSTDYPDGRRFSHNVSQPEDKVLLREPHFETYDLAVAELPTVLLTHVPFYRDPGTPCGPLREKYPPTDPSKKGLQSDERNSIRIAAGYQYQNVLTKELSTLIADKVGHITHIFSGDDHDYCEVVHRTYPSSPGGIKEITVKSISWAMGVRRPGIVLASLWNPIDGNADPLPGSPLALRTQTIATHLCLMPNQLGIFIQYAFYLIITIICLVISSALTTVQERNRPIPSPISPILPTKENGKALGQSDKVRSRGFSGSAHTESNGFLAARSANARVRVSSPGPPLNGYAMPSQPAFSGPLIDRAGYYPERVKVKDDDDSWIDELEFEMKPISKRRRGFAMHFGQVLRSGIAWVAVPSFAWFLWLWHRY